MPIEIDGTIAAIKAVRSPRFLATERGYHGAFYCALQSFLKEHDVLTAEIILEMEYQKSWRHHGTNQRPDIVLHIPREISQAPAWENNYAVWALKRVASEADAIDDFEKLDEMCDELRYPLAIFVNVASEETHLNSYGGRFHDRIHSFAFAGVEGSPICHSFFRDGVLQTKTHTF